MKSKRGNRRCRHPRRSARTAALALTSLLLLGTRNLPAQEPAREAASQGKEDEKATWDVQAPPGPRTEARIRTDEGTWMSVDVSPDGSEVVFDLLGDIYSVNVSGTARALTSGVAWDMQPRFSPDGKSVAFTSDRGGGDNIWIMDHDGANPRPVTSESFRLLNSPAWTPDGEFIAARKHFTSARSLGAGEIWLYHRSGGDGVQLVERPNDQKDLGEPAFSPDGRYVYYSQDATPGNRFEYNKDSNAGIYVIQRFDRETGETEEIAGGPGGACRPAPSPDGRWLAFVRRVRVQSVLFLKDLETGAERPVYDALDRDMQETWAIHGVYPAMGWTADSATLVFWSGGKIRRLQVASGRTSVVPFEVDDTRTVTPALRHRVEVAPESFEARALRWMTVSPRGDLVVFQALGHLWVRDLPGGANTTPRRLTRQEEHFEHYPSFSRDGEWIVYTTWDDAELGSVRVVPARGGEGRVVSPHPGHYVEPVFTPDGATILYRAISGGHLRSPRWSLETGLFRVPAAGGEPERLLPGSAGAPHFGADPQRIYFTGSQGDRRTLESMTLDGSERRAHLSTPWASEFRVSPDGKWAAFVERFHVYVVPLIAAGRAVEIAPGTKKLPIARVSRDAGESVHWSGDSRRLYWSLGPELFERRLEEAFAFLEGAPEELPDPPELGIRVGLEVATDIPSGRVAFVGGRVITMEGDEVIERGTVIVERNRIVTVGEAGGIRVPDGAHVVDAEGLTILPGLVDVHAHGAQGTAEIVPEQNWIALAELAFGVTTIHDPSNDTSTVFAASEMARAGRIVSPRVFSTGTILYGATTAFTAEIDNLEDARRHLRRMQAFGAFSVKSYNQPRRDQRQQVIAAARALEVMVVPEGGSLFQHNMTMLIDGHTGIEHNIPVAAIYGDTVQLWSQTGTGYTPTLVVSYGGLSGEYYWYQHTNVWENERLLTFVPREAIDARSRRRLMAPEEEYNHLDSARVCKQLTDAGVKVNLGAHGQREGLGAHWELWMFVQGGMTPHEALRAATLNGAHYLGLDRDIGSIARGKLADLIVLEGNPLEDIRNSERVRFTMVNGRLYDARTLDEVGNHPHERAPLYWEDAAPGAGGAPE